MRVDFFIVGGPKCGTSALAFYLDAHEHICFARPKETWFFDTDLQIGKANHGGSVEDYHDRFYGHYLPEVHTVVGEGTPLYLFSQDAISNILSYNPNAKFVVMIRKPVDMAQSWHSQLVLNGREHEPVLDFEQSWRLQEQRCNGESIPERCVESRQLQYRQICALGSQLERLYSLVQPYRVLPLLLDDMTENPRNVYLEAETFLGVEDDGRIEFPRVNANKTVRMQWLSNVMRKVYALKNEKRVSVSFGLGKRIERLNILEKPRASLRPEFLSELKSDFLPEIEKLEFLLNRDLAAWK